MGISARGLKSRGAARVVEFSRLVGIVCRPRVLVPPEKPSFYNINTLASVPELSCSHSAMSREVFS
jgi:hypothetical protein